MEFEYPQHHTNETTLKTMKRYWILTLLTILTLQACNESTEHDKDVAYASTETYSTDMEEPAPPMAEGLSYKFSADDMANGNSKPASYRKDNVSIKQPDKIIKTGRISIEVDDYATSLIAIKQLIGSNNGYIASENEQRNDYRVSNTIVIRVLNDHFDQLMEGIASKAGKLNYKNVDLRDVTEEYTDLAARMKTKKEVEQRYLEILKTAKTVKDILEVEDKLRYIREEIESTEARLKYLDDKVQYSTITLEMSQELDYNPPAPMQVSFFDKLGKAVKGGWNGLLGGILIFVNAWPFVVVLIAIAILVRRWRNKRASLKA